MFPRLKNDARFLVGYSAFDGRPLYVDERDLKQHALVVGSSGSGKSRLIESLIREIARAVPRRGALLIDPHGSAYENLKKYFAGQPRYRNRVLTFDVNDEQHFFGLNMFQPNGLNIDDQVSQIIRSVSKVAGDELDQAAPRRERWERNTFLVAVRRGLTWPEIPYFLLDDELKMRLVDQGEDFYLQAEWSELCAIKRVQERWGLIEAVLNRTRKFVSDHTSLIFGQPETTIPIRKAMDEGLIILVNLLPKRVSLEVSQMIGILLCDTVLNAAMQRTPEVSRPFYFFVDECGEMASPDLARSLNALRKFCVSCTFACQELEQLRMKGDERLYEACLTDCHTKLIFSTSYKDSETLANELFVGKIRGDQIKHRNEHTVLIPRETTRKIRSTSWMDSESESETDSDLSSASSATGSGVSSTFGGDPFEPTSYSSESTSYITSGGSSSGHATSRGRSSARGGSESEVPFYEYLQEKEESGRDYYSVEEMKEKFRSWIANSRQRFFQFKIRGRAPLLARAPEIRDVTVSKRMLKLLEAQTVTRYCLPRETVLKRIELRKDRLLIQGAELVEELPDGGEE